MTPKIASEISEFVFLEKSTYLNTAKANIMYRPLKYFIKQNSLVGREKSLNLGFIVLGLQIN